jgi:hypothetical protein
VSVCIVDATSCSVFVNEFKRFSKKHHNLREDLERAIQEISSDYKNGAGASRVPRRAKAGKWPAEVWKYEIGSTDLKRSAKNCFRAIGVFREEQKDDGAVRTLFLVLWYFKGDQAEFDTEELLAAVRKLTDHLTVAAEATGGSPAKLLEDEAI